MVVNKGKICLAQDRGCFRPAKSRGYCHRCYQKVLAGREPMDGKSVGIRGQKMTTSHGYIAVYLPEHSMANTNGYLLEHRLVMAEALGRDLLPQESVHHKNGTRTDNRLENLELWSTSQPMGQRAIDKLQWARYIVDLYKDLEKTNV